MTRSHQKWVASFAVHLITLVLFAACSASPRRTTQEVVPVPRIVGYFTNFSNYPAKSLITSGSAERLSVINYAFAVPSGNRCVLTDSDEDYKKIYGPINSVDGKSDIEEPLRGNFGQLKKLKQMYPHLKIVISIGGWTGSGGFSDASLPENREAFVASCIDMFIKGNVSVATPPGIAAGLFDGIDIDWEYPAAEGAPGNVVRPEDAQNFTALLAEFRKQLDAVDPNLLLTIAASANERHYSLMEIEKIHPLLDWINLMTYDFHGAWEAQGPTNFHSPLYGSDDDPSTFHDSGYTDYTVQSFLKAGVPPDKLVVGVPFYGRGWTGVKHIDNGRYQPAERPSAGAEPGSSSYATLRKQEAPGFLDPDTKAYFTFDGTTFWSYDTPESLAYKTEYVMKNHLGGIMFWELGGDTRDGELIKAIAEGLSISK